MVARKFRLSPLEFELLRNDLGISKTLMRKIVLKTKESTCKLNEGYHCWHDPNFSMCCYCGEEQNDQHVLHRPIKCGQFLAKKRRK